MNTIEINDVKAQKTMLNGHPDESCISFTTGDGKPVVWFDDSIDGKGFMTENDYNAYFTDSHFDDFKGSDFHACFCYANNIAGNSKQEWEACANDHLEYIGVRLGEYHDTDNGGYYDLLRI